MYIYVCVYAIDAYLLVRSGSFSSIDGLWGASISCTQMIDRHTHSLSPSTLLNLREKDEEERARAHEIHQL